MDRTTRYAPAEPDRLIGAATDTEVMGQVLTDYSLHLRRRNLAQRSRECHMGRLRLYCRRIDPFTTTLTNIEEFLDSRDLCARARLDWVGCLAGFHRWLVDERWRRDDPTAKIVRPKLPPRLPRPIADADLRKALQAAEHDQRMKTWLMLAAYGGLRVSEMAGLQWSDVNFQDRLLVLRVTKGLRPRAVPMATALQAELERWDRYVRSIGGTGRGPVFPAMLGGCKLTSHPMNRITLTNLISKHLHGLGIDATAHNLRHWYGTETYRRTMDLRLVGDLLGHSDLRTTQGYVKLVPSKAAIEALHDLSADERPES